MHATIFPQSTTIWVHTRSKINKFHISNIAGKQNCSQPKCMQQFCMHCYQQLLVLPAFANTIHVMYLIHFKSHCLKCKLINLSGSHNHKHKMHQYIPTNIVKYIYTHVRMSYFCGMFYRKYWCCWCCYCYCCYLEMLLLQVKCFVHSSILNLQFNGIILYLTNEIIITTTQKQ